MKEYNRKAWFTEKLQEIEDYSEFWEEIVKPKFNIGDSMYLLNDEDIIEKYTIDENFKIIDGFLGSYQGHVLRIKESKLFHTKQELLDHISNTLIED